MKIFSSFDTKFKQEVIEKEWKKHWKENFSTISHGKFYKFLHIIFPIIFLVFWLIIWIVLLIWIWGFIPKDMKVFYYIVWLIILLLSTIPISLKIFKSYINYILDFVVVNPYNIIYYDQEWIFDRSWRTIDVDKIKTISVKKNWLIRSFFNYWNLIILTEWDEQGIWEINFTFVDNPDKIKRDIFEIIESRDYNSND